MQLTLFNLHDFVVWVSIEMILNEWGSLDADDDCCCADDDYECEHETTLEAVLRGKEDDEHVDDLVEALRTSGWLVPATAIVREGGCTLFGDGHHRLIASRDLGMKTIPVRFYDRIQQGVIRPESGAWYGLNAPSDYSFYHYGLPEPDPQLATVASVTGRSTP